MWPYLRIYSRLRNALRDSNARYGRKFVCGFQNSNGKYRLHRETSFEASLSQQICTMLIFVHTACVIMPNTLA